MRRQKRRLGSGAPSLRASRSPRHRWPPAPATGSSLGRAAPCAAGHRARGRLFSGQTPYPVLSPVLTAEKLRLCRMRPRAGRCRCREKSRLEGRRERRRCRRRDARRCSPKNTLPPPLPRCTAAAAALQRAPLPVASPFHMSLPNYSRTCAGRPARSAGDRPNP